MTFMSGDSLVSPHIIDSIAPSKRGNDVSNLGKCSNLYTVPMQLMNTSRILFSDH